MQEIFLYFLIVGSCAVCYFDTLNGDFVFDDRVAIVKNRDVSDIEQTNIEQIFQHDFWGYNLTDPTSHKSYRPLTTLMFRFEYGTMESTSYHMKLINLILHCCNSCFLYKLFLNITKNKNSSLYGAILFATHPIHTEVVCGIVGRGELMFCICLLIALQIFITFPIDQKTMSEQWIKMLIIWIIAIIGLLFKENAITILPICVCYDFVFRTHLFQQLTNRFFVKKIVLKRLLVHMKLVVLLIVGRLCLQNFESPKFKEMDNPVASNDSFITRVLSQNYLYALNCWILFCPYWLSFDWALGCIDLVTTFLDYRCLTILLMYFVALFLIKFGSRTAIFAIGILTIGFLPASGVIKVGFVIAERVLYVPSIGFCLLISNGFCVLQKYFKKQKMIVNVFGSFLLYIFIIRTRQRASEWMNEETLYSSALLVCPNNAKIHYNVALVAVDKGNRKLAFDHYHKAISLYPEYEAALMNLGNLYRDIGDLDTAEKYLKQSIEILEDFPAAWMNLGIVHAQRREFKKALESYEKALSYKKRYATCLYNIGNLYLDQKNYSEAVRYWQESIILKPKQPKAWANILTVLDSHNLYEDGLRTTYRAESVLGDDTSILFIRANMFGKLQNYIEAEQLYLKVISRNPNNALYHTNLGVLYHRWNKNDQAIKHYKTALNINPNLKNVHQNLRTILNKQQIQNQV